MTQTTVSENFLVPLNVWAVYAILRSHDALRAPGRGALAWAAVAGLLFGCATGIKPTVIAVLPGAVALFWVAGRASRAWLRAAAALSVTLALTVASLMAANVVRFGRFELSNSKGRHLWNIARKDSEGILAGQEGYVLLRSEWGVSELQQMKFWQLAAAMSSSDTKALRVHAANSFVFESFLRSMVLPGVRCNLATYVAVGVSQFWRELLHPPASIGVTTLAHGVRTNELGNKTSNPLGRTTWLPPLVAFSSRTTHRKPPILGLYTESQLLAYLRGCVLAGPKPGS